MPVWSGRPCYPLCVHNRYPAIYAGCNNCPKYRKALHNHSIFSCKILFVDKLLNNKTVILLNVAKYRFQFSQLGLRPHRLSIRRYFARFRRIIVKYSTPKNLFNSYLCPRNRNLSGLECQRKGSASRGLRGHVPLPPPPPPPPPPPQN